MNALALLLLLPPGLRPWPPPDAKTAALVREALSRNEAGIAAVHTLTCRCTAAWLGRTPDPNDMNDFFDEAWDYWLAGDTVRVRVHYVEGPLHWVRRGDGWSMIVWFKTGAGEPPTASVNYWPLLLRWDARKVGLFTCWESFLPYQGDQALAQLLDGPHEVWAARRVTEDGVESVYLDLAFPGQRVRAWLDPAHNYLVRKAAVSQADQGQAFEYQVTAFRRSADGTAAVPVRVEKRMSRTGQRPATLVTALSEVRINEPVPPEALRIPGLAGLKCIDTTTGGKAYRLDENGESAGPWGIKAEEGRLEPDARRVGQYILAGLVAAGLLLAGVNYWRRKRAERGTAAAVYEAPPGM